MHCVVDIDGSAEAVAYQTRSLLEFVTRQNMWIMSQRDVPPLYKSGVRFRTEPWADKVQHFASCTIALERRFADCKVLCAWRAAELRREYPKRYFGFKIYWRWHDADALHGSLRGLEFRAPKLVVHHVQIRHQNGGVEDPSRLLHR